LLRKEREEGTDPDPPGAHRFQADVETVHNLVEIELSPAAPTNWKNSSLINSGSISLEKIEAKKTKPLATHPEKKSSNRSSSATVAFGLPEYLFKINYSGALSGGYHVCIAPSSSENNTLISSLSA